MTGAAAAPSAAPASASEENQEGRGQQGFEGPEKTLEIEFDPDVGHEDGLRAIRREQWDAILEQVRFCSQREYGISVSGQPAVD